MKNNKIILLIIMPYLEKKTDKASRKIRSFLAFPYGVLSMLSFAKKKAFIEPEFKVIDLNLYYKKNYYKIIKKEIDAIKPDIIGLSMMFDQSYKYVSNIVKYIKAISPLSKVIIGGAAATVSYEEIINDQPHIDALCYSEGETAMLNLINAIDLNKAFQDDPWVTRQSLEKNKKPLAVYTSNLNDLIEIDYKLIECSDYKMKQAFSPFTINKNKVINQFFLMTSRGCPFNCIFCAETSLHGKKMRFADVDVVIDHVAFLVNEYQMNVLTLYDDQLLIDMPRAKELFRKLAQFNLRIETPNGVTVRYIDDEMAFLMKSAGIDTLPLAIESGSKYVIEKIIRKPINLDKVHDVVKKLQMNNIFVQAYFVVGLPGERDEDRKETVRRIKEWGLDWSGFSLASPVRGSELFEMSKKNGYISNDIKIGDIRGNEYIFDVPELDLNPKKITEAAYYMNLNVNFVNNRMMKIGKYAIAVACFKDVLDRYEGHAFAHYYLALACAKLNEDKLSIDNLKKYYSIISSDMEWRSYAIKFGLPLTIDFKC